MLDFVMRPLLLLFLVVEVEVGGLVDLIVTKPGINGCIAQKTKQVSTGKLTVFYSFCFSS